MSDDVKTKPKKHAGGRPTKYKPELCIDIVKFFSRPLYIKRKRKEFFGGEVKIIEERVANDTPYLIDWCRKHKIDSDTPHNWAKHYPEFFGSLNTAKRLQERFLTELGVKGEHNAFMTFQALKNVDCLWGRDGTTKGWQDKTEIESKHREEINHTLVVKFEQMPTDELTGVLLGRHGHAAKLN